jgi:hypothetical protein
MIRSLCDRFRGASIEWYRVTMWFAELRNFDVQKFLLFKRLQRIHGMGKLFHRHHFMGSFEQAFIHLAEIQGSHIDFEDLLVQT